MKEIGTTRAMTALLATLALAACGSDASRVEPPASLAPVTTATDVTQSSPAPTPTSAAAPRTAATDPEPTTTKPEQEWTLVALGDSLPYGRLDCNNCTPFPELYAQAIEADTGVSVAVKNLSDHTGLTSARLLDKISHDGSLRTAVTGADVITVTIGHNDSPWGLADDPCDGPAFDPVAYDQACVEMMVPSLRANLDKILLEIEALRHGLPTVIRVTNFHNDSMGDPTLDRAWDAPSKLVVEAYNAAICDVAAAYEVPCIDMYHAFNGPTGDDFDGAFVVEDHVHPNQAGHQVVADLLRAAGYAPLA